MPPPPLPCCLWQFVSFRYPSTAADAICHCRALLKTPLKTGGGSLLLSDLWSDAVYLQCIVWGISVSKVFWTKRTGQKCLTLYWVLLFSLKLASLGRSQHSQRHDEWWSNTLKLYKWDSKTNLYNPRSLNKSFVYEAVFNLCTVTQANMSKELVVTEPLNKLISGYTLWTKISQLDEWISSNSIWVALQLGFRRIVYTPSVQ